VLLSLSFLLQDCTQNPFKVNLTFLRLSQCLELLQCNKSLYLVEITEYGVIKTPFIVMPNFSPNDSQIYLKLLLSVIKTFGIFQPFLYFNEFINWTRQRIDKFQL
jgi:hypothetical protein